MINLLDAGAKRELRAARMNVTLATYCGIVAIAVVCVVILIAFSYWWLENKTNVALSEKASNEAQTSSYASVKNEAAAFSTNLGKIQSVLSNRSHYSTALLNIAESLPAGAYVNTITLSPTFITTPLSITASTATYQQALALKETLSKSKLYSKVVLNSANCTNGTCAVDISATMNQTVFTAGTAQ